MYTKYPPVHKKKPCNFINKITVLILIFIVYQKILKRNTFKSYVFYQMRIYIFLCVYSQINEKKIIIYIYMRMYSIRMKGWKMFIYSTIFIIVNCKSYKRTISTEMYIWPQTINTKIYSTHFCRSSVFTYSRAIHGKQNT